MSNSAGPKIIRDLSLILNLDAANKKSYPGTGTSWTGLSQNKAVGTMTSCTFSSGNQGSIAFNGTSSRVYYPSNTTYSFGTNNFTVDFWVYFNSVAGAIVPICQSDAVGTSSSDKWWIGLTSNQLRLGQHSTANGAYCAWSPSTGIWYNGLIQRSSGTVSIFINGISQSVTNPTIFSATSFSQNGLSIGAMSTPYYLNGNIANFKMYNQRLTSSEVYNNFVANRGRFGV
jgi:hypothetical protein